MIIGIDNFQWERKKTKLLGPNNKVDMPVITVPIYFEFEDMAPYDFDYDRRNKLTGEELQCEIYTFIPGKLEIVSNLLRSNLDSMDEEEHNGAGILDGLVEFMDISIDEVMADYYAIDNRVD